MTRPLQDEIASSDAPVSAAPAVDVSVVIVNYNVCEFLVQAIRSVQQASRNLTCEIWVVDNNSIDDSVETLRRDFPDVRLIANENNAGFGTANNQAIRQSKGEFVFILNPDTIVQEDTLDHMVAFMRTLFVNDLGLNQTAHVQMQMLLLYTRL